MIRTMIRWWRRGSELPARVKKHFAPAKLGAMVVAERAFPSRMRADLQRALDGMFGGECRLSHFTGVLVQDYGQEASLASLATGVGTFLPTAPLYDDVDVGEDAPVRCLRGGLWLGEQNGEKFAVLLTKGDERFRDSTIHVQVGVIGASGTAVMDRLFDNLEKAVRESRSYRGKVLSLEQGQSYRGQSQGIKVHKLRRVNREDVILPAATLALLERNVVRFVEQREKLGKFGQSRKKGLLFYGPPGTGKTHTIHYLAGALAGHTTLLISAEQVGLLGEYMVLARLLQPSLVVIEDADLIARSRQTMHNACEEVLLNKLLNEMDGLREDADVLFVLTTNRPESLEEALRARPGRVDQAIEFPLPDDDGRRKLVGLYGRGAGLTAELVEEVVKRTEKVSGAFIKELMRRTVQFHLERNGSADAVGKVEGRDVSEALEEMVFRGGELNMKLLGGAQG